MALPPAQNSSDPVPEEQDWESLSKVFPDRAEAKKTASTELPPLAPLPALKALARKPVAHDEKLPGSDPHLLDWTDEAKTAKPTPPIPDAPVVPPAIEDPALMLSSWGSAPAPGEAKETVIEAPVAEVRPATTILGPPQFPGDLGQLGPYRIRKLIGEGGMGLVFQAEDMYLKRPVALKVMRPDIARDDDAWRLFLKEAQATAALKSPRIATIYQIAEEGETTYLAMELLHGLSLETRLHRGPVPLSLALWIIREAALGLATAHQHGFFHRDIKPANLWLEQTEEVANRRDPLRKYRMELEGADAGREEILGVKILDFGLVRLERDGRGQIRDGTVVGTPAYMAPEQARGQLGDERSDIFSLGVVLYRLVAGQLPFPGETPLEIMTALASQPATPVTQFNPNLPHGLVELIHRMLAREPLQRPESAAEVAAELEAIEQEKDVPVLERPAKWQRWVWVAAVIFLVIGSMTAILYLTSRRPQQDIATAVAPSRPTNATLAPKEAFDRIGEQVRVEFAIRSVRRGGGRELLLYSGDKHPSGGEFRIVISPDLTGALFEHGVMKPDSQLVGSVLRVHGVVVRDSGNTEIQIGDRAQIEQMQRSKSEKTNTSPGTKAEPKPSRPSISAPTTLGPGHNPQPDRKPADVDEEVGKELIEGVKGLPRGIFGKIVPDKGMKPPPK